MAIHRMKISKTLADDFQSLLAEYLECSASDRTQAGNRYFARKLCRELEYATAPEYVGSDGRTAVEIPVDEDFDRTDMGEIVCAIICARASLQPWTPDIEARWAGLRQRLIDSHAIDWPLYDLHSPTIAAL